MWSRLKVCSLFLRSGLKTRVAQLQDPNQRHVVFLSQDPDQDLEVCFPFLDNRSLQISQLTIKNSPHKSEMLMRRLRQEDLRVQVCLGYKVNSTLDSVERPSVKVKSRERTEDIVHNTSWTGTHMGSIPSQICKTITNQQQ